MNTLTNKAKQSFTNFSNEWKSVPKTLQLLGQKMKQLGFKGCMKAIFDDLFANRTVGQWLYLITLSFIIPLGIEFWVKGKITDPVSLFTSITGIICVILVAEGRASNYLFGLITNVIYLLLSIKSAFYGEVATMIYFIIMQPIGLYVWLKASITDKQEKNEDDHFLAEAKKFTAKDWIKYIVLNLIVWQVMGWAYKSIHSNSPFRDSITDATNFSGQLAQTAMYREQWIFWILTNVFSMYLWFGNGFEANTNPANLSIMVMYLVYTINSVVGWIQWSKSFKK